MASSVFNISHASTTPSQNEKLATVERTSLYMNLQDHQYFLNKKFILHRLVYISAFDPEMTDRKQIADYYEVLFHKLHSEYQEMPVTGLLLMHSTHYIHLLESSIDMLYSVIRDLANQLPEKGVVQSDIKILVLSHNIPDRLYRHWLQRSVNMPVTLMMGTSDMEPVDKLVPECLTLLLKLGNYIMQNPKNSFGHLRFTCSSGVNRFLVARCVGDQAISC